MKMGLASRVPQIFNLRHIFGSGNMPQAVPHTMKMGPAPG
jgi:hypothetical protein